MNAQHLEAMLKTPEKALKHSGLVYVQDHQLSIYRLRGKKGFSYRFQDEALSEKEHLERIKHLVIPPAWQNVRITPLPNGHLQAVGRDLKNRKQYRYHQLWIKIRSQTKFYKMVAFAKQLPKIRQHVDRDLDQPGWSKNKVLALIIRLMEETQIRIGNEQYAKRNKTYGLSTMRTRHVKLQRDKIKFEFTGKKGKQHKVTLRNKKLIRLVQRCEEIPGWELFQYYDKHKRKHSVESSMVNAYLHQIAGVLFTAKDFRTWAATVIFFDTVMDLGVIPDEKARHKNILKAYDITAKALGNTRNICKKYYVHPAVVDAYQDGTIEKTFEKAIRLGKLESKQYFSVSEEAVLHLLKNTTVTAFKKTVN